MASLSLKGFAQEKGDILLITALTGIVMLMVIPIPPFLIDLFLVLSISTSILILLISFYSQKPLDFSAFPTLLLFTTLLRLTLNIASTRLILLNGSEGEHAAGEVIKAFGYFVAGGNYVVGFIVFIILVIINFIVITKGAGRIAEVAARFTLDSMPGKQLAIDADLNAGLINDKEATSRREELQRETDFYGAMDGASKFVRGDAIAGIMITAINVVGGFIIGIAQKDMDFVEAAKVYTILSVGDGLVSQLPALIISTASGLLVTKVSKKDKISVEISKQAFANPRPLGIASVMLFVLALIPALPAFPFLVLSGTMGFMAYKVARRDQDQAELDVKNNIASATAPQNVMEQIESVPPLDNLEVEVGYDLVPIVDQRAGGEFPSRILGIRKQLATEMGLVIPSVHIRDNLKLKPTEYRIYLKGAIIAQGELLPHHHLALDPGMTTRKIEGIPTKDPTFGLPAIWVSDDQKENAIIAGYTVVDLPSVLATHLSELIRHNLHELFGRQELSKLLDQLKTTHPRVISDLIPELLSIGTVLKVMQTLLKEQISIRNVLTILETLAEYAPLTKDSTELTEQVRIALGRAISQKYVSSDENLYVITLDRALEEKLSKSITQHATGSQISLEPMLAKLIVEKIGNETKKHVANNQQPVLLTSQQLRPHMQRLIERFLPDLAVLAHSEVAGHVTVRPVGLIEAATAA